MQFAAALVLVIFATSVFSARALVDVRHDASASAHAHGSRPQGTTQLPDGNARLEVVGQWFDAIAEHVPGKDDEALTATSRWSRPQLLFLRVDLEAIYALVHDPKLTEFRFWSSDELRQEFHSHFRTAPVLVFDGTLLERMRPLAQRIRGAGVEAFSKRAVLLHTDLLTLRGDAALSTRSVSDSPNSFRVFADDARLSGVADSSAHWELARFLVARTANELTPWIRSWYRATVSYLLFDQQYGSVHLRQALLLFPEDAQILLLTGAQHAALASPGVQSFVSATRRALPVKLPVLSTARELERAEQRLRQAIQKDPECVEAYVRLGHVLAASGRHPEAAEYLRVAVRSVAEPVVVYYAHLILGAVLTASGEQEAARMAYQRASELFPRARLPHLALAASAFRRGNDGDRRRHLRLALADKLDESAEPWYDYHKAAGRHANMLLDTLRQSAIDSPR
jgi:tetratricopeptide (TPR) repeat protein